MLEDCIDTSDEDTSELDRLMRAATRIVCATRDYSVGLARFNQALPELAPDIADAAGVPTESGRSFANIVFREIWNRVPRPDHGFRALPLPKQERNSPCQCGSGKKFKQCCAQFEGAKPFDAQGLSLLKYVLEDLPQSAYENLPFRHMSPEELAFVASQWLEEGKADTVTFLLVPLLRDVSKLDARHEPAFDLLGDAYLQLGMPAERTALVGRMIQASDVTLRCAALHRRCTILSDAGDWDQAWRVFAEAQRQQPNNMALSHLEVVMLAAEGRTEHARERAKFWVAQLRRRGLVEPDDPLMDFLRTMSEDPEAALAMTRGEFEDDDDFLDPDGDEWASALIDLLEALPAPACHYALQVQGGNAGELAAAPQLAALEQEWLGVLPAEWLEAGREFPLWEDTEWVGWLAEHPLAWQSFRILDDVAVVIGEAEAADEALNDALDRVEADLLAHAAQLLERVIAANQAQGCLLEWAWLENRPALRLLAGHIELLDDADEELRLLQWLVTTLDPLDNQGQRELLVRLLLKNARAADALALCARYPDDGLNAMRYARVLALHQLGRLADASAALAAARQAAPRILTTLIAVRPRQPDGDGDDLQPSADDEAWYYRMDWLPLWTELGALKWLKKVSPRPAV